MVGRAFDRNRYLYSMLLLKSVFFGYLLIVCRTDTGIYVGLGTGETSTLRTAAGRVDYCFNVGGSTLGDDV